MEGCEGSSGAALRDAPSAERRTTRRRSSTSRVSSARLARAASTGPRTTAGSGKRSSASRRARCRARFSDSTPGGRRTTRGSPSSASRTMASYTIGVMRPTVGRRAGAHPRQCARHVGAQSWSPDGKKIVFRGNSPNRKAFDLYVTRRPAESQDPPGTPTRPAPSTRTGHRTATPRSSSSGESNLSGNRGSTRSA
jgi:hypothetical protein